MNSFIKSLGSILSIFPTEDYERFVPKEPAMTQAAKELDLVIRSNMDKILKDNPILKDEKIDVYGDYITHVPRSRKNDCKNG